MLPLIRGLLPHPLPARRIPNRAVRTCRRTRLPRFNAPVGDVPRDQRGRPPTALQPLDRLRCRAIAAAAATGCPFWSCGRGRFAPPSAGAYPTCPRRPAGASLGHPWPGAMRRGMLVTGAVGSAPPTPSHARLLHLPPPKIPLRRRLCAKTQAAPFPPGYFRERKGRSRRPSDAGPRADRAPLCGKSRAAPVPVQQLPGRLTNSEWPVFVPGGAPCLLYRRSRRRSIRGDRSSCFRLRMRPLSRHPRRRSAQRPAPPASSSSRPPRLPSG